MTLRYLLPILILGVGGCAASTSKTPAADARSLAASFAAGRAFDLAQSALKRGDDATLRAAGRDYARATALIPGDTLSAAVISVMVAGMQIDVQSKYASLGERPALQERALAKYRAASAFLPAQPAPGSVDADTLNSVGYPLADRGTTRADWTRALQLTQLSLNEWDRQLKKLGPDNPNRIKIQAARNLGALDSHAWSLFRLGRTGQALREQEKVLKFARDNRVTLSADVPFHLAEIYRASGRDEDAQREYEAALGLNPDPELALKIDAALNGTLA